MKTILISVLGTIPAIITETVWALASEDPKVIPDDVVVLTTEKGADSLQKLLLQETKTQPSVWHQLRRELLKSDSDLASKLQLRVEVIQVESQEGVRVSAIDIRSFAENTNCANQILASVRQYCNLDDCQVIASIAGGRKTMGVLLYGAMTLAAKESDRLTHVLVSEPYENCREFFYPSQKKQKCPSIQTDNTVCLAKNAKVELVDIPFVPLKKGLTSAPIPELSFGGLVKHYSAELCDPIPPPILVIEETESQVWVNEIPIHLGKRPLLYLAFCAEIHTNKSKGFFSYSSEMEDFWGEFATSKTGESADWSDLSAGKSDWKRSLSNAKIPIRVTSYLCPGRKQYGLDPKVIINRSD